MTRAEYLEHVQEALSFPTLQEFGGCVTPTTLPVLRDTPEVCRALHLAHAKYCAEVELILFPERREQVAQELLETCKMVAVETMLNSPNNRALKIMKDSAEYAREYESRKFDPCECNGVCDGACVR